jgi:hypothetical protein
MRADELPELTALEQLIEDGADHWTARSLCAAEAFGRKLPVYAITLGSNDPAAPAVGFFGGVHGLERIGTQVLLAFMRSLLSRLRWDKGLQQQLESIRLVFMPLINPGGMSRRTHCNPQGVDLMRNAPLEAREKHLSCWAANAGVPACPGIAARSARRWSAKARP